MSVMENAATAAGVIEKPGVAVTEEAVTADPEKAPLQAQALYLLLVNLGVEAIYVVDVFLDHQNGKTVVSTEGAAADGAEAQALAAEANAEAAAKRKTVMIDSMVAALLRMAAKVLEPSFQCPDSLGDAEALVEVATRMAMVKLTPKASKVFFQLAATAFKYQLLCAAPQSTALLEVTKKHLAGLSMSGMCSDKISKRLDAAMGYATRIFDAHEGMDDGVVWLHVARFYEGHVNFKVKAFISAGIQAADGKLMLHIPPLEQASLAVWKRSKMATDEAACELVKVPEEDAAPEPIPYEVDIMEFQSGGNFFFLFNEEKKGGDFSMFFELVI